MKKILKTVVVVLGALPLVLCSCNLDPDRTCNIKSGSTELFSEEVLQEFNIPWLTKPEGATNEKQYKEKINWGTYYYEAIINTQEQFTSYVEDIFKEFSKRNYIIANYYETVIKGEAWSTRYGFNIAFDNNMTYMFSETDNNVVYRLYYTAQPLGEYNDEVGGREVSNVNLIKFTWNKVSTENSCNVIITLYHTEQEITCYFLDEVPQEE